jgi:hypothetical protein
MSMQDRQQKACARGKQSCATSNYSLDASGMSLAFIENLNAIRRYFPPRQFGR